MRSRIVGIAIAISLIVVASGGGATAPNRATAHTTATFPARIYPPAASFPPWGPASGCPSAQGLMSPVSADFPKALATLRRFGANEHKNRRLSDRAFWPVLRDDDGGIANTVVGPSSVRRATRYPLRSIFTHYCGARVVKRSLWIAINPGQGALEEDFLLLRRAGHWLLWHDHP